MTTDTIRSLLGDPATVEAMTEAFADAYGYYVKFHRGLKSESSDRMRDGMREAIATLERLLADAPVRACTCHPDDNPPRPCPQNFAYSECIAAAPVAPGDEEIVEAMHYARIGANTTFNHMAGDHAALAAARPLLARQSTRRTDEEVEREIERQKAIKPTWFADQYSRDNALRIDGKIDALRWTLNKTEPGR